MSKRIIFALNISQIARAVKTLTRDKHFGLTVQGKHIAFLGIFVVVYFFFLFVWPCHRVVSLPRFFEETNQNGYQTSVQAYDRQKEDEKIHPPPVGPL